jgi:hypothetical protein
MVAGNTAGPETATLLPHNPCGKTGRNVTVGEKVPAGRMRGSSGNVAPSPRPSPPQWIPIAPGETASGREDVPVVRIGALNPGFAPARLSLGRVGTPSVSITALSWGGVRANSTAGA